MNMKRSYWEVDRISKLFNKTCLHTYTHTRVCVIAVKLHPFAAIIAITTDVGQVILPFLLMGVLLSERFIHRSTQSGAVKYLCKERISKYECKMLVKLVRKVTFLYPLVCMHTYTQRSKLHCYCSFQIFNLLGSFLFVHWTEGSLFF